MTNLADRFFTYAITGTNLITYHNNPDLFAYVATSWYISNKFYRVIINTKALKRLIVGYRQYLVYRKTYNTVINTLKLALLMSSLALVLPLLLAPSQLIH